MGVGRQAYKEHVMNKEALEGIKLAVYAVALAASAVVIVAVIG